MVMAVRVHALGGPEVLRWEEIAPPVPGPGQVVVRNTAVAVNMLDVYQRIGRPHPNQPSLPYVPGSVNIGVVARCAPDVQGLEPGQRVACMGRFGAYSEQTAVDAGRVVAIPDDLADADVAAIFVRGLTAYYLTHLHHCVMPGQVLLVHAAAGGLGQLLCRWITHLGGRAIGTVSTADKAGIALAAGCTEVIVREEEDFVQRCAELTGNEGVHVVYDSIGRDTVRQSLQCLRTRGHVIVCGAASGIVDDFSLEWLHAGSCMISRPTVMTYVRTPRQLQTAAAAVFEAMRGGILRLRAIQPFRLADAALAHRALESRAATGTPILVP